MMPMSRRPLLQRLPMDVVSGWLDQQGIEDGLPFLVSPDGLYDVGLNSYFRLNPAPENTQAAIAYDLTAFFTFLWCHREPVGARSWRDADPEDRAAYHRWRRVDENGPGVKGSTWGREVATVNSFIGGQSRRALLSGIRYCSASPGTAAGAGGLGLG